MSLAPGFRLGPYEIQRAIGAGGMGEVYRARDTRLDRTVAVKILPAQFAADPQLRERFDREARAISSLSHPHICALFDVGRQDDIDFLVMEFLEGQTLAERLDSVGRVLSDPPSRTGSTGPGLQLDQALQYAIQIAGALDKAHCSGIVHRDLKPANVMLTKAGAKLLDFGLAKTNAPVVAASGLSMMPTTPPGVTAQGTILGTFQYMAPEQIEGLEADARTDIFAFGALLFEMLTGRTAFEGKTRASLLGAILKDEPPPVSQVQPVAPKSLDRIISTCLAKDPDDRWQSARDLGRELKWVASGAASGPAIDTGPAEAGRHLPRSRVAWAVAGALGVALIAASVVVVRHVREVPPAVEPIQFTIAAPEDLQFGGPTSGGTGTAAQLAVSPDGRNIVFVAGGLRGYQLWLRPVAGVISRPIPGTEDGKFPFWSPDGRFVGFFAAGKLKKVAVAGGPPVVLCDGDSFGGTWNRDNIILFTPVSNGVLQRVSGAGGVPVPASAFDKAHGETSHRWPHFLPDGRHFLFTASIGVCCPATKPAVIRLGALDSMQATTLFEVESSVAYASGHLLFSREGVLMAERFDPDSRQLKGDPFPVADDVVGEGSRYASFAVSESGVLAYARGVTRATTRLTWFDRQGRATGTVGDPAPYWNLALSPDERKVAVSMVTGTPGNRDIWIIDLARGSMSRLTFDPGDDSSPIWAPDGSRLAFQGMSRRPPDSLRQKVVSGTVDDEPLLADSPGFRPTDWSTDGRFLAYARTAPETLTDLWILPLSGDRKPFPFVQSRFIENNAVFAPNGNWIAYNSSESGQTDVYVQPFPPTGGKYQISKNGGSRPLWRADGKELFFLENNANFMAATVDTAGQFEAGVPQRLFSVVTGGFDGRQYAVSADGKRFLVNTLQQQPTTTPLTVVVNWLSAAQK
jgi:eukaryotic-like serine/threonine-protein kinase